MPGRKDESTRSRLAKLPAPGGYTLLDHERRLAIEDNMSLDDTGTWRAEVTKKLAEIDTIANLLKWALGVLAAGALTFIITSYVNFSKLERLQTEFDEHRRMNITDAHPGATEVIGQLRTDSATTRTHVDDLAAEEQERDLQTQRRLGGIETSLQRLANHGRDPNLTGGGH